MHVPSMVLYLHVTFGLMVQCSLPYKEHNTLVSRERYGIVFVDKIVMAEISARSQSLHFGLCAP